jgi:predicted transcriptional regulator
MRSVKVNDREYWALAKFAKEQGQFIQYHLNEAIRQYLQAQLARIKAGQK